jgi:hypothetical protein
MLASRSGSVIRYRSVSLTALLTLDPAEATRFAEAAGSQPQARLWRVSVRPCGSTSRKSRALPIPLAGSASNENTVGYRVKQSEEIIHRSVDERRLELEIALRLAAGLGGARATSVQHAL